MPLLSKQPPSVSYFERQQVVKGPPIPVAKRLETCPTIKSHHPVSLQLLPWQAVLSVQLTHADTFADKAACNLPQQQLQAFNQHATHISQATTCIWYLAPLLFACNTHHAPQQHSSRYTQQPGVANTCMHNSCETLEGCSHIPHLSQLVCQDTA
jgi:hypothetical protein